MLIWIIFMIVSVVVLGYGLNCLFGRRMHTDPEEGASVQSVLVATELLAGLLLAIVVTDAGASYSAARAAAKEESDVIDTLYESAQYVEMPFRQQIQADAACYARAVVGPEWKALAKGELSSVPRNWTGTRPGGLRATFLQMTPEATGFDLVQEADVERGRLRSDRVTQANPSIPPPIIWFVVVLLSLSLGGVAYSIPRKGNRAQLVAMGVVMLTFLGAMALIYNLDRPFSGVLGIEPTALRFTEQGMSEDYVEEYKTELPCDREGNPSAGDTATSAVVVVASTTTIAGTSGGGPAAE